MKIYVAFLFPFLMPMVVLASDCNSKVPQQGREEPNYIGLSGFIKGEAPHRSWDEYRDPPRQNWVAYVYDKQVGPTFYETSGKIKLKHKTPVKIISQSLEHVRYGAYSGLLTVTPLDNPTKQYLINPRNFTAAPFWSCSAKTIKDGGNVIAEFMGNSPPVDTDGRWVKNVRKGAILYCGERVYVSHGFNDFGNDNQIVCRTYSKKIKGGWQGEIIYEFKDINVLY